MPANLTSEETELVDRAVLWLDQALPQGWEAKRSAHEIASGQSGRVDAVVEIRSSGTGSTFAVEARRSFSPRDAERLLDGLTGVLRMLGFASVLVVAPWLSRRTRELLEERRVNYVDLTGNALVRLENPPLFIRSQGASRDPAPLLRGLARVRGPKAARIVRILADVRPPYGVREISVAVGVAAGYVSRILDALDREALVERSPRGRVEAVDVPRLLRRFAESYDVFKSNATETFLSPAGAQSALERMAGLPDGTRFAITGSFAGVRLAPVAAPALLVSYCDDIGGLANLLDLLPADEGANAALLEPYDPVVWERTSRVDRLQYVAPSQVALDCLSGNGRMPSEGEAVLAWMVENESLWRNPSIRELRPIATTG